MLFPKLEEAEMNTPEWLKPSIYGAAVGAIALAVVGFSWGGWVTGASADRMATEKARHEVVAALVPICIQQSNQDPQAAETLTRLKETSRYQRDEMLMKAGWATMPGSTDPDRAVATACMEQLARQF